MGLFRHHNPARKGRVPEYGNLVYGWAADKDETGETVNANGDHMVHFRDGSWFNATTGELYNATGDGMLRCTGYHWAYQAHLRRR